MLLTCHLLMARLDHTAVMSFMKSVFAAVIWVPPSMFKLGNHMHSRAAQFASPRGHGNVVKKREAPNLMSFALGLRQLSKSATTLAGVRCKQQSLTYFASLRPERTCCRTGSSTATRRVSCFERQPRSVGSASGPSATAAVASTQRSSSIQNEDGLEWDEPELEPEAEPEGVLVLPPPSHSRVKTADFVKSSTAVSQCPPAKYPEFAVIGRSNVGKSSLINMLTGKKALAQISKTPGKTKCINHFIINNSWFLVDLPGYGYAKRSKDLRLEWNDFTKDYLLNRETLANVLLLIDASIPPTQVDLECADWLAGSQVPFALVFTKLDKRKKGIPSPMENIDAFKEALMEEWEHLPFSLETSALKNTGRQELLSHIASLRVLWQQEH